MASFFGETLRVSIFGQSHGAGIGVVIEGLPAGEPIDETALQAFLARRAPGQSTLSTARREADIPRFLSGICNGRTAASPLCAVIENTDMRSGDYAPMRDVPRPGHADYTARMRYGDACDMRGGGHFSGRLTAPLCIAGGIASQILARRGIHVGAHIAQIGSVHDTPFDPVSVSSRDFQAAAERTLCVNDESVIGAMQDRILCAKRAGDSVGGVIECAITGLPAGLGDPMFDGVENRIARAVFGIPAVKGLSFGSGFAFAQLRGSQANDAFCLTDGCVRTKTNQCGGILGGITTGMPVVFCAAFKPTPSISVPQQSVDLAKNCETTLVVPGRHDPCIVVRAVPCVEAAAACVALDLLLCDTRNRF